MTANTWAQVTANTWAQVTVLPHRPSAGADLVYLSFWMGTTLETVTKFRAFGSSSRTNSGFVLLSPGQNLGTPAFGGPRRPEIQEIHRGLGNGFRKRSGLYKIDKFFRLLWGSLHFGGPRNRKSRKSTAALGLEHILGRSRRAPFSKMWPPLNGHMDSHSSSFSGATHKERPGLPRKG